MLLDGILGLQIHTIIPNLVLNSPLALADELVVEVDAELWWKRKGWQEAITRVGNLVFTSCGCAQRLRVNAGRVEEIEWQNGEDVATWMPVGQKKTASVYTF